MSTPASLVIGADPGRGYAAAMIHLRIVVPTDRSQKVLDLLEATPSVCNLVSLPGRRASPSAT